MLVHPWDAPLDDSEWRGWLLRHDFGQLIAPGAGRDLPIVVPTHFLYDGATTVRLHLAKPNPVWAALAERPRAVVTVVDDAQAPPGTVVGVLRPGYGTDQSQLRPAAVAVAQQAR